MTLVMHGRMVKECLRRPERPLYIRAAVAAPYYLLGGSMGARLKLLETLPQEKPRRARADIWLTVSAWLWAAYFAGLAAFGAWLVL